MFKKIYFKKINIKYIISTTFKKFVVFPKVKNFKNFKNYISIFYHFYEIKALK